MTQLVEGPVQHLASLLPRPAIEREPPFVLVLVLHILIAHVALGGPLSSLVGLALLGFAPNRAPLAIIH